VTSGIRLFITRPAEAGDPFVARLVGAGVQVEPLVTTEFEDLDGGSAAVAELDRFDLVLLTSPRAVRRWAALLEGHGRALTGAHPPIAVVGAGTARRVADRGVVPALTAPKAHSEGLAEAVLGRLSEGGRVLHPGNAGRRPVLGESLRAAGVEYRAVDLYRSRPRHAARAELEAALQAGRVDAVLVTAGSALDALLDEAGQVPPARYVALGPVTAARFAELDLPTPITAADPTADGVLTVLGVRAP
jgi:uroporphyrinogen-III synthase